MCKLQWKNQVFYHAQIIIFKIWNTVENPKTMEHHWGPTVISSITVIAINHFILRNFSRIQNEVETRLYKLHLIIEAQFRIISIWRPKHEFSNTLYDIDYFGFYVTPKFIIILVWNFLYTIWFIHQKCTTSKNRDPTFTTYTDCLH